MRILQALIICASLALFGSLGCGKSEEKKESDQAGETASGDEGAAKAGDKASDKAGDKAAQPAGNEPIICCEFGGAVGTSTKSKCEGSGGKVVADKDPPCT